MHFTPYRFIFLFKYGALLNMTEDRRALARLPSYNMHQIGK